MEVINGTLRMTSDRVLLKPLEWDGEDVHGKGSRIKVIRKGRPLRGIVKAIGPGHYPLKYIPTQHGPKGSYKLSKHFRPTEVKVGDQVEIGGLNAFDGEGYSFPEVLYNGEKCIICQERDIAIVTEE